MTIQEEQTNQNKVKDIIKSFNDKMNNDNKSDTSDKTDNDNKVIPLMIPTLEVLEEFTGGPCLENTISIKNQYVKFNSH